jgi:hypothetical protein
VLITRRQHLVAALINSGWVNVHATTSFLQWDQTFLFRIIIKWFSACSFCTAVFFILALCHVPIFSFIYEGYSISNIWGCVTLFIYYFDITQQLLMDKSSIVHVSEQDICPTDTPHIHF